MFSSSLLLNDESDITSRKSIIPKLYNMMNLLCFSLSIWRISSIMVSCLVIEYACSLFLEKLFNLRWWDYSYMKFNLDGRICLENGILFGIAGVLVIKVLYPFLSNILHSIPNNTVIIIGLVLASIFLIDIILSYSITFRLKKSLDRYSKKDATEDIKKLIRVELTKKRFFVNRLIKSFPNARKWYYSKLNIKEVISKFSGYRKK